MVGWHHRLDGHELKQAPGDGEGQGSMICCSPWGHKELNTTEQLNWSEETNTQMPLSFNSSLIVSTLTSNSCLLLFFLTHLLQPSSAQLSGSPSRTPCELHRQVCFDLWPMLICPLHNCSLESLCLMCTYTLSSTGLKFLVYKICVLFSLDLAWAHSMYKQAIPDLIVLKSY